MIGFSSGPSRLVPDDGVQCGEGDAHVGRVDGDTVVGGAEDGVLVVLAGDGGAAAAGDALVAGPADVGEVAAAGALEEVPADRGHVAQLPGGSGQYGLGECGVVAADVGVGGEVAVGDGGADAQAAFGGGLDAVQGEFADVDEAGGPLDAGLHQVDEVGATAEEPCVGVGGEQGEGVLDVVGAAVVELPHAAPSSVVGAGRRPWVVAAWATAWTMET